MVAIEIMTGLRIPATPCWAKSRTATNTPDNIYREMDRILGMRLFIAAMFQSLLFYRWYVVVAI